MARPFKLKSQGSSFKMMGSSPAKNLDVYEGHPMDDDSKKLNSVSEGLSQEKDSKRARAVLENAFTSGEINAEEYDNLSAKGKTTYYTGVKDATDAAIEHGANHQTLEAIKSGKLGTKENPYSEGSKYTGK